ncbi:MAG: thioredoxin family protein [Candidatus Edwardsbacteria bacterium]|jgi:glutaredoxin-like protein|nr:thioredoxin family protein [Candidatus Edwardsbacteria bacterium]
MPLLKDEDQKYLRAEFARKLTGPVKIVFFTQAQDCMFCQPTEQIIRELLPLSDKLSLETHAFAPGSEEATRYGIDKIPAIVLVGAKDYGVRFYGIPAGFEFSTLVADIIDVSRGETSFSPEARDKVRAIAKPVDIQVFVSPTCPYCPPAVRLAHMAAIENGLVTAAMVESTEFPHLAHQYNVAGVPRTIFNGTVSLEGAAPEALFIEKLLEAAR